MVECSRDLPKPQQRRSRDYLIRARAADPLMHLHLMHKGPRVVTSALQADWVQFRYILHCAHRTSALMQGYVTDADTSVRTIVKW
jgi:hypothetical protein